MELVLFWRDRCESTPSPLLPGRQIRLIQIMQMTCSLARITGHSMRRSMAERESSRLRGEFGRVRKIRNRGERRIEWETEEKKEMEES